MSKFKLLNKLKTVVIFTIILLLYKKEALASGQDFMRSMGKMYVVVGVIAVIFIGLAIYLLYMDRKIQKLEKKLDDE